MIKDVKHIVISRTDSIGDVILTLPLCGILKSKFPECKISFLGKSYTQDVVSCSIFVDDFINLDELNTLTEEQKIQYVQRQKIDAVVHVFPNKELGKLFKKSGVKHRIGTSHRLHHFRTCNHRPNFTRKKSALHESQLNVKLLRPFGIKTQYELDELSRYAGFDKIPDFPTEAVPNFDSNKTNIVLHPKSQGSAVEWGMDHYTELIELNKENSSVHFYITGTEKEAKDIRPYLPKTINFTDVTGSMSLKELIGFIYQCDCIVACSTGPLHIGGILNRKAIGLFSPKKPIHPGRWKAIGMKSIAIVNDPNCKSCQQGKDCACIKKISATRVSRIALQ